ncbi:putative phosphoserine aminotransferase [Neolecta irregularis DAH-3]|uniref:phosphoserine transaminase n=1 Tax=Neolecta irregularis (strain DAH-3) TaxID=1198029 RepID=A0A1U7LMP5_NEOID|nr:putative phosphoserine aminotransferase [Neolecta irregularis DAH-3]|eukprot:OLL23925.1 putative phosphoserine aminotransferase [Neolecta irregularis DAH-3]
MSAKRSQILNFSAGPACLPTKILEQAAKDLIDYAETGISLAELSHRSSICSNLIKSTQNNLRKLLGIPDNYSILFMQGGGTAQFSAVVYNLLAYQVAKNPSTVSNMKCDYIVTGSWGLKAAHEAKRLGAMVNIVSDPKKIDGKYGRIPDESTWNFSQNPAYIHYCDNETVDGVEFAEFPKSLPEGVPVICDMSSNILSREFDVSKYAVIYAGAQKNFGIAGITMIIVRNDILERADAPNCAKLGIPITPVILDYKTTSDCNSLYNTLPMFNVRVANLVFENLLESGGVAAQERISKRKAEKLYSLLEKYPDVFEIVPGKGYRSRMNVTFRMGNLEEKFISESKDLGFEGLKGHRSVGGIRASFYNAMPEDGVDRLIEFMETFVKRYVSM